MSSEQSGNAPGGIGDTARETFAAWKKELAAMARPYFGDALKSATGELRLQFRDNEVFVFWLHDGQMRALGQITASPEDSGRTLRELLSKAGIGVLRDGTASFPASDVLRPTVRLPRAPQQTLRRALGYELERLSPVSPDEVYFDFAILSRDRDAGTVEIEVRIIRRDIVDRALALCRSAGLAIGTICFESDERPVDWRAFPVDRNALLRFHARRWNLALLAGSALALLLAVLLALYLRGAAEADDLADQLSVEGVHAARVERLQQRIDRATTQLAFLEQQKRAPLFVSVLNDVTRTLPDGTWITELDMTGNKLRIEGYSHAASDLIGVFDRSGHFANAQFAAPVTQSATSGVERFDLTVSVAGQKP